MKDRREVVFVTIILTILLVTLGVVQWRQSNGIVKTHVKYAKAVLIDHETHTWIAATCTKPKTCSECGATEGKALGHNDIEKGFIKSPTCTSKGSKEIWCSRCGRTSSKDVPALGHEPDTSLGRSGTGGWFDDKSTYHYQKCKRCGQEINKGEHDKEGHGFMGFGTWCSICYRDFNDGLVEVTELDITESSKTINMVNSASTSLSLTINPESAKSQVVWSSSNTKVATVDNNGKVTAVAPGYATITATAGTKTDDCSITVIKSSSNDVCKHTKSVVIKNTATCTKSGKITKQCTDCKEKFEESSSALGHDTSGAWQNDENEHWKICSRCKEKISSGTHTPNGQAKTIAATCTTEGKTTMPCSICYYEMQVASTPALGHKWGDWKTISVGVTGEKQERICSVCKEKETQIIPPSTSNVCKHTDKVEIRNTATCTNSGTKLLECKLCGLTFNEQSPALGHNFKNGVCVDCGRKQEIISTGISVSPNGFTTVFHKNSKGSLQLTATITPSNATNKNVKWYTYDPNIAKVNSNGLVEFIGVGKTTIFAETEDGGLIGRCFINLLPEIDSKTIELKPDEKYNLPTSMSHNIVWSTSSNLISLKGDTVTANKTAGTATVIAKVDGQEVGKYTFIIKVEKPSLTISAGKSPIYVGESTLLSVKYNNIDNPDTNAGTWRTSATDIVKFTQNTKPEIIGLKQGEATVSYEYKLPDGTKLSDSCTIEVSIPTLRNEAINMVTGGQYSLPGIVGYEVLWTTNSSNLISVNGNVVTAKDKEGTATVNGKLFGKTICTYTINITKTEVKQVEVKISGNKSVEEGQKTVYTATTVPANAKVTWSIKTADGIAGIDKSSGQLTADKAGGVQIIATATAEGYKDGTGTYDIIITLPEHEHDTKGTSSVILGESTFDSHLLHLTCSICGKKQGTEWEFHKPDQKTGVCTVCEYQLSREPEQIGIVGDRSRTIREGESLYLTATIIPAWTKDDKITWSSDKSSVASVDSKTGVVKGNKAGNDVKITAKTSNGKVDTITVNVVSKDTCSECLKGNHTKCKNWKNYEKYNEIYHSRKCCDGTYEINEKHNLGAWQIETADDIHYKVCSICNARVYEGKHKYNSNGLCECGKLAERKNQTIILKGASKVKVNETIQLEASTDLKNAKATWSAYTVGGCGQVSFLGSGDIISVRGLTEGVVSVVVTYTPSDSDKNTYRIVSKAMNITVEKGIIDPESITLGTESKEIYVGDTFSLSVNIKPSGTKTTLDWDTDNDEVAKVDNGKVTGVGKGTATIAVTTGNGKKAKCIVTVKENVIGKIGNDIAVTGVSVSPSNRTIKVDEEIKLIASLTPTDATNKSVSWSSSDESIATVSQDGNVRGIAKGTATITVASLNNKKATCKITVNDINEATSIEFEKEEYDFNVGEKIELDKLLVVKPDKADLSLKYEFVEETDKDLAVLDIYTGKIEFTSEARIRIMATDLNSEKYATTIINVESNPNYVAKLTVSGDNFVDVSKDAWYYENIKKSVEDGLFKGTSETEFSPNETITRGMFITVLARYDGDNNSNYETLFTDVPRDSYYANAVSWAVANGIADSVSDGGFAPNQTITRQDMAVILNNYIRKVQKSILKGNTIEVKKYNDQADISPVAEEAINTLSTLGIIQGFDDGTYKPNNGVTRAEAATIMQRLTNILKAR